MIGKQVLHYKIQEKLGGGGMGVVYKALDTKLDRFVALKFLPAQISCDETEKKRFIHEAKAASALQHSNIGTIYDIDETKDGQMFICMEHYQGETLKKKIEQGPLPIVDAIEITKQICAGLASAHEAEIIHRDIKPANIMITDKGVVKIVDFGLAKAAGRTKLTRSNTTLGTIAYMSPEQAQGLEADHRSDIWALGVVLYEMVTGKLPFKGENDPVLMYSIVNETPEPITGLHTGVPLELERIVNKCLEKDASIRYQHSEDVIADLKKLKEESRSNNMAVAVSPKSIPTRKTKQVYFKLLIIFLVIAIGIAGFWFLRGPTPIQERIRIAVVDVVNETDESELDGLSGLLITALEQSRRLDVMSRARMFDELKKMGRDEVAFVDEAIGRELAKHTDISALAVATIRKLGETYSIDFKVIDPVTGDHLFVTREEGRGQDSIFGMIDRLSEKTRIDLNEEARVVEMANLGIADVTTPNMDAYHHYFMGEQQKNTNKAVEEFQKAIELDSLFGLAYYKLAYNHKWVQQTEDAEKALRKALQLIDRIPAKERYLVKALEAELDFDADRGISILQEMLAKYPDEKFAIFQIGDLIFHFKEDHSVARSYFERAVKLDPLFERAWAHLIDSYRMAEEYEKVINVAQKYQKATGEYESLVTAYEWSGDLEMAREALQQYATISPKDPLILTRETDYYLWENRFEEAKESLRRLFDPKLPVRGKWTLARINISQGKFEKALRIFSEMISVLDDDSIHINHCLGAKALLYAHVLNNRDKAYAELDKINKRVAEFETHYFVFYTYLMLGDYEKALAYSRANPGPARGRKRPIIVTAFARLKEGRYSEAIEYFKKSLEGSPRRDVDFLRYFLARSYLAAELYDLALAEIRKAQSHYIYSYIFRELLYPRSFHLLGKIYEKKGHTQLAIQNYEKFLDLWKDADEDLPDLIDAKAGLAKLRGDTNYSIISYYGVLWAGGSQFICW